jgi:hypothetical protein
MLQSYRLPKHKSWCQNRYSYSHQISTQQPSPVSGAGSCPVVHHCIGFPVVYLRVGQRRRAHQSLLPRPSQVSPALSSFSHCTFGNRLRNCISKGCTPSTCVIRQIFIIDTDSWSALNCCVGNNDNCCQPHVLLLIHMHFGVAVQ